MKTWRAEQLKIKPNSPLGLVLASEDIHPDTIAILSEATSLVAVRGPATEHSINVLRNALAEAGCANTVVMQLEAGTDVVQLKEQWSPATVKARIPIAVDEHGRWCSTFVHSTDDPKQAAQDAAADLMERGDGDVCWHIVWVEVEIPLAGQVTVPGQVG